MGGQGNSLHVGESCTATVSTGVLNQEEMVTTYANELDNSSQASDITVNQTFAGDGKQ